MSRDHKNSGRTSWPVIRKVRIPVVRTLSLAPAVVSGQRGEPARITAWRCIWVPRRSSHNTRNHGRHFIGGYQETQYQAVNCMVKMISSPVETIARGQVKRLRATNTASTMKSGNMVRPKRGMLINVCTYDG